MALAAQIDTIRGCLGTLESLVRAMGADALDRAEVSVRLAGLRAMLGQLVEDEQDRIAEAFLATPPVLALPLMVPVPPGMCHVCRLAPALSKLRRCRTCLQQWLTDHPDPGGVGDRDTAQYYRLRLGALTS